MSQQILRQSANDPQIQIAEDSAAGLARGEEPEFIKSNIYGRIDMAKSLAPFLITFDGAGKILASTAILGGVTPIPPAGVFAYAKKHGEDRITWQPEKGVRIAAVLVYHGGFSDGFALAGRSLREVEMREDSLEKLVLAAWLASIFAAFAVIFIIDRRKKLT